MTYTIFTNDANKAIKTIFDCVKKGEDPQKVGIDSWEIQKGTSGKEHLVHTPQQWSDKGYLDLIANSDNDRISVNFYYWSNYPSDQRNNVDEKYILGRFSELLLVHFDAQYNRVNINK